MSPNGTDSAPSPSSTARTSICSRAAGNRCAATSRSCRFPAGRYVLDGEIVLFDEQGRQDFDALGQRIHPAESRINMLAEQTPTRFVAFDLLALDDESLLELPQRERRDRLDAHDRRRRSTSRRRPRTPPRRSRGCTAPRA